MDFGLHPLDSSVGFWPLLLSCCIGLLLASLASFSWNARRTRLRWAARALAVLVSLWYVLQGMAVWRFGIQWEPQRPDVLSGRADIVFLIAWLSVTTTAIALVKRLQR